MRPDWFSVDAVAIDVEVTTLDRLIEEFGVPRFRKIDVEGFELDVLRGLSRPIPFVSFEYNIQFPDRVFACLDELERFGIRKVNLSKLEKMHLVSDDWWDRPAFERYFREELARAPEDWGGDIYVKCEAGQS